MAEKMAQSTPLAAELAEMIAADGPMPVERFMALALGHPAHGYYMGRDPFGRGGDFVTAPEVSQMFGELIGIWCVAGWQMMDAPDPLNLIELGPGRGTLMSDLLRAGDVMPGFLESVRVHLVETSPALRERQRETLKSAAPKVEWHDSLADVPAGPALIVANEFLDALPVQQLIRGEDGWHERMVGIGSEGELTFGAGNARVPENSIPDWAMDAETGSVIELSPRREAIAREIGQRLATDGGASLLIDYGHVKSAAGDTLQAVRNHRTSDVLDRPGESDITSHVDFAAVERALTRAGARTHGPLTQGQFLLGMGLKEREDALKRRGDARQRIVISRAAQRLAAGSQMGHLFKVLAATHPEMATPAPFGGPPS